MLWEFEWVVTGGKLVEFHLIDEGFVWTATHLKDMRFLRWSVGILNIENFFDTLYIMGAGYLIYFIFIGITRPEIRF